MAALYNAFCNILRSGDEIVSSASLYGGSIDLFRDLEAFGITTHYVETMTWLHLKQRPMNIPVFTLQRPLVIQDLM